MIDRSAINAATVVADLVNLIGSRPDLILEDKLGDFRHQFFFERPADDAIIDFLIRKGFVHQHWTRTPHDPECDVFLNEESVSFVMFSDPAQNHNSVLWSGPPPEPTVAGRYLDKFLADRDFQQPSPSS